MTAVTVERLDHLVLTVADVTATTAFYSQIPGMRAETFEGADGMQRHALLFGEQKINLHEAGREFAPHAAAPMAGSADLCFLICSRINVVAEMLRKQDIKIEEGPIRRTGARGPILSIYFRDPDGTLLELAEQL